MHTEIRNGERDQTSLYYTATRNFQGEEEDRNNNFRDGGKK